MTHVTWSSADELRPYVGRRVAILNGKVIHSEESLRALADHLWVIDVEADSIFRVPRAGEHDEHR